MTASETKTARPTLVERQKAVAHDFRHWVIEARQMVHANFTGDEAELQRLTMQAANSLMLQYKLGEIEISLNDIKLSLNNPTGS